MKPSVAQQLSEGRELKIAAMRAMDAGETDGQVARRLEVSPPGATFRHTFRNEDTLLPITAADYSAGPAVAAGRSSADAAGSPA
jgi:hypothetical protein